MSSPWWPFNNNRYSDPWYHGDGNGDQQAELQKLVFFCQLAHGSPTIAIKDFATVQQLYKSIAEAFEVPYESILYCTLNTHKVDMNRLLGSTLSPEDFIFCHVAGQPKELELMKSENQIGLTITDNGSGIPFVKAIQPGSIAARHGAICVGDHIQRVNGESVIGLRHFDVANRLRNVETGTIISLRIVSPMSSGFSMIGPAQRGNKAVGNRLGNSESGRKTLRFRADGKVVLEDEVKVDESEKTAVARVDSLLDSYLGVSDTELAERFWELAKQASNPAELSSLIENADAGLKEFSMSSTTFVYDLWGIVTDNKRAQSQIKA